MNPLDHGYKEMISMITKHFFAKCLVLGVILSVWFAGTASAALTVTLSVNGQPQPMGSAAQYRTEVDSTVTFSGNAQGAMGDVRYDWYFDSQKVEDQQTVSQTFTSRGRVGVTLFATDAAGQTATEKVIVEVVDSDGPDPSAGPAFRLSQTNVRAVRFDGSCLVIGRIGYESYRSSRSLVKVVVQKRLRQPRSRADKKWKRFTSLSRTRTREPSYDVLIHDVMKKLNPNGARLTRLSRKYAFRILVRQTVAVEGKTMYTSRLIKPFQPRACRIPTQPPQGSPAGLAARPGPAPASGA